MMSYLRAVVSVALAAAVFVGVVASGPGVGVHRHHNGDRAHHHTGARDGLLGQLEWHRHARDTDPPHHHDHAGGHRHEPEPRDPRRWSGADRPAARSPRPEVAGTTTATRRIQSAHDDGNEFHAHTLTLLWGAAAAPAERHATFVPTAEFLAWVRTPSRTRGLRTFDPRGPPLTAVPAL